MAAGDWLREKHSKVLKSREHEWKIVNLKLDYFEMRGFLGGSVGKESAYNAGDADRCSLIPWLGRSQEGMAALFSILA